MCRDMGLCERGTDDPQIQFLRQCLHAGRRRRTIATMTLGLQADPCFFASLTPLKARLRLRLMGVDGRLKGQTQEFGFQDSKRGEQARMEGMRRLLTRQRVMRPECQLPKGKDRASCTSLNPRALFERHFFIWLGWASAGGRQGLRPSLWRVNSWLRWVGSSSLTRGQTQTACIGSMEPSPLDC